LQALKIQRGTGNSAWLWVEYRQPIGIYDSLMPAQAFAGALIHYDDGSQGLTGQLLDFTPATSDPMDAALLPGQTWVDPYSNLSINVQSATASALTVNVSYGVTSCAHSNPTVTASPLNPSAAPGSNVNFTVTVKSNDSAGCSSSPFNLSSSQPSGFGTTFSATSLTLSPDQSGSVTMTKAVPTGAAPGTDPVDASAANGTFVGSGAANLTVVAATSLSASLSSTATTYVKGQTAALTATVLSSGNPVAGATVTFIMTKPGGTQSTQTAKTGSTGQATWNYKFGPKDSKGNYSAIANAVSGSQTAQSNSTSFTFQ
jgi:hypothetical protein